MICLKVGLERQSTSTKWFNLRKVRKMKSMRLNKVTIPGIYWVWQKGFKEDREKYLVHIEDDGSVMTCPHCETNINFSLRTSAYSLESKNYWGGELQAVENHWKAKLIKVLL